MKISADFKKRVLAREWLAGSFVNLGSSVTVEITGNLGFDWILIDHEHGPGGEDTLLHQMQAASATPAFPMVRIANNDPTRFKRVLDVGAQGVMVPWVSTVEEAKAAVNALRYTPRGMRGIAKQHRGVGYGGNFEEYYRNAHDWIVLATQLETPEAVANSEAIAAIDGVDVLFVGPTDLTFNMGIPDQYDNPKFIDALKKILASAKKSGKAAGILVHNPQLVTVCRDIGYTFVALGSDGGAMMTGLKANLAVLRGK